MIFEHKALEIDPKDIRFHVGKSKPDGKETA